MAVPASATDIPRRVSITGMNVEKLSAVERAQHDDEVEQRQRLPV